MRSDDSRFIRRWPILERVSTVYLMVIFRCWVKLLQQWWEVYLASPVWHLYPPFSCFPNNLSMCSPAIVTGCSILSKFFHLSFKRLQLQLLFLLHPSLELAFLRTSAAAPVHPFAPHSPCKHLFLLFATILQSADLVLYPHRPFSAPKCSPSALCPRSPDLNIFPHLELCNLCKVNDCTNASAAKHNNTLIATSKLTLTYALHNGANRALFENRGESIMRRS